METISQRELRNNSGDVLRRVAAGESFVITNGGSVAAVLSPPDAELIARLQQQQAARGRLRPARTPLDLDRLAALSVTPTRPLDEVLAELRSDR